MSRDPKHPHQHEDAPERAGGHSHSHHDLPDNNTAFAIGVALNLGFVVIEVMFGVMSNSLALIADAGHNFSDVLGLLLAWGAATLAARAPSLRLTYGLRGSTILAALANAMLLLVAVGVIGWEAFGRFSKPEPTASITVIWVALVGVVINGTTALLFMKNRKTDLNVRGAYLHMMGDAAISLGVALAAVAMLYTGWLWLDPLVSMVIAALIFISTWGLLREAVRLAVQAVPEGIDPVAVRHYLASLQGVKEVHDLHIWAMSTLENALTVHLVMPDGHPGDDFLAAVADGLQARFKIGHPTLQVETASGTQPCRLAPEQLV